MIKIGSDFSGVGAFPQALIRLGIEYDEVFACDMDRYARQTYCLNFGTEHDLKLASQSIIMQRTLLDKFSFYFPLDVYERNIPEESLDIYCTSPPCQAFSMAGKRMGKDDQRGILFFNSLEFIKENKPRYFIFENVKGLLSHDKQDKNAVYGRTFQEWINYLGGKSVNGVHTFFPYEDSVPYHIYFQVLNAKHYGIPQNRERVFIIGIRDDEDNDFQFPKPFHLEKRLKDVLEMEVDEKYFLSDKMLGYLNTRKDNFNNGNINYKDENSVASTLTKSSYSIDISDNILKVGYVNQDTQASQVFSENGTSPSVCAGTHGYALGYVETENSVKIGAFLGRNPENPSDRTTGANLKQTLEINESGTSNALTSVQKDNVVIIQSNTSKGYDEAEEEEDSINFSVPNSKTRRGRVGKKVSQTLDTQCNQGIFTQQRIRRLTPTEAFRLMDFNEEMIDKTISSGLISDSQLYKQAGNSICVGILSAIISKLKF